MSSIYDTYLSEERESFLSTYPDLIYRGNPGFEHEPEPFSQYQKLPDFFPKKFDVEHENDCNCGCCGQSKYYYSPELNALFGRDEDEEDSDYSELLETAWAGTIIQPNADGIYTISGVGYVWTGDQKGIDGTTFIGSSGSPDPDPVTLIPLPKSVSVLDAGVSEVLSHPDEIVGAPLTYVGDTKTLTWDWSSDTWYFGSNDYEKEGEIGEMLGEYSDGNDPEGLLFVTSNPTGGGNGGASSTGVKPSGPEGSIQLNFGGALQGSSGFRSVSL